MRVHGTFRAPHLFDFHQKPSDWISLIIKLKNSPNDGIEIRILQHSIRYFLLAARRVHHNCIGIARNFLTLLCLAVMMVRSSIVCTLVDSLNFRVDLFCFEGPLQRKIWNWIKSGRAREFKLDKSNWNITNDCTSTIVPSQPRTHTQSKAEMKQEKEEEKSPGKKNCYR